MKDKKADVSEILAQMRDAKEEPSAFCTGVTNHDFQFLMHADGRESFSNYYKCSNCGEVIVRTQERTGINRMLWE